MSTFQWLAVAFLFSATAVGPAHAVDPSAAVAEVRAAADAADEQLVEQRRRVWARLDASQKASFARNERAWLNDGRAEEEQKCLAGAQAPAQLAEQACRLLVTERRLVTLSAPIASRPA